MHARLFRTTLPVSLAALTVTVAACATPQKNNPDSVSAGAARVSSTVRVPSGFGAAPFNTKRTVTIPKGWKLAVWARVKTPRLSTWTPDHRLIVSRPAYGDVVLLTPHGSNKPSKSILVKGLRQPHGLAFRGSTLYVAESNQVDTFTYKSGRVSNKKKLFGGLPDSKSPELHGNYAHALKSIAVRKSDGTVFVSVGSTGNVSAEDRSASPQRATIMRYAKGKLTVAARGVRNGTGLALDPDDHLWTAVNNRDRIQVPSGPNKGKVIQSYVNDHPMEELARLYGGRDLGWPYCNPNPNLDKNDFSDPPFVHDQEMNPTSKKLDCSKLDRIEQGFPAHSAPLGLSFTTLPRYGAGAIAATHGSWNRNPPRAPTVAFFHWYKGRVGNRQVLVSGFQNSDGSRWGRPVSAVRSPWSHSLYITDDSAGAIYSLTPA